MGYPIVGDKKYKCKTNPIKRLCLHANIRKGECKVHAFLEAFLEEFEEEGRSGSPETVSGDSIES